VVGGGEVTCPAPRLARLGCRLCEPMGSPSGPAPHYFCGPVGRSGGPGLYCHPYKNMSL